VTVTKLVLRKCYYSLMALIPAAAIGGAELMPYIAGGLSTLGTAAWEERGPILDKIRTAYRALSGVKRVYHALTPPRGGKRLAVAHPQAPSKAAPHQYPIARAPSRQTTPVYSRYVPQPPTRYSGRISRRANWAIASSLRRRRRRSRRRPRY